MRTTLKQISEATHLSITIVSQVLNDRPCRVSKENRQLILDTAKEMNYRPNLVAVSLVKGSTNTIGLAISDIRNNFFSVLAKGVEEECQKNNWNVILCNSNDKHTKDMDNLRMLADKGANGIIFGMASETTVETAKECIDLMDREQMPYLLVDRYIEGISDWVVCVDHLHGGRIATKYLLEQGHRHIACITGPENLLDSEQRLQGYREVLEACGLEMDERYIAEGRYTFDSGARTAEELMNRGIHIDAIFAFNDIMAIGAIKQLRKHGIRIPEDISIIGYDDIFMDEFLDVPLTTIRQPAEKMGRAAARLLIRREMGRRTGKTPIVFEPELIKRKSVVRRMPDCF